MRIISKPDKKFFEFEELDEIKAVKRILKEVKDKGDKAVAKYTKKFDNIDSKSFEITKKEIKDAYKRVDKETINALKEAAKNIRYFAKQQLRQFKSFTINKKNITLGQNVIPLEKVGCYAPGGRYPLPSSALMCIIPAKVAGVEEVIVCSPKIKDITIVASDIAGADRIFNIGGVQAIGAMAFGTKSVPKVDKIVGPGNNYVTAAKKEVYGIVGIDFTAGASEIMIIADDSGDAKLIAADLLAQAEHDPDAKVWMVTTSKKLAEKVNQELDKQLAYLSTKDIAKESLKKGMIIIARDLDEAIKISNKKAPEHVELQVRNPQALARKLRNYGSLFIGKQTAEVFGDYCSGTNHVLPTNGAARYAGGLSVKDFIKISTFQRIRDPARLIKVAVTLAQAEGLDAHKKAALARAI